MKLKILNLNAWLLPLRLSTHNAKRLDKIFNLIEELDPDVITFQEVWDVSYIDDFHKKLKNYFCMARPNWLFNKAGLLTFTKYPVVSNHLYHFKPTKKYSWFEKGSKKGFLVTRINVNGKEFDIVNTHLYAGEDGSTEDQMKITINQFKLLERFFNKSTRTTILSGDLNMDFSMMKQNLKVFNMPNKKSLPTYLLTNKYTNNKMNKTKTDKRQLDYFLYIKNGMKIKTHIEAINNRELSDHDPLYFEATFS